MIGAFGIAACVVLLILLARHQALTGRSRTGTVTLLAMMACAVLSFAQALTSKGLFLALALALTAAAFGAYFAIDQTVSDSSETPS